MTVDGLTGLVPRPTLVGAIAAKSAALEIIDDPGWKRHVQDVAVLSTLIRRGYDFRVCSQRDLERIANAIGRTVTDPSIAVAIEGAAEGLDRLRLALKVARRERHREWAEPTLGDAPG